MKLKKSMATLCLLVVLPTVLEAQRFFQFNKVAYWYGHNRAWHERKAQTSDFDFLDHISTNNSHFGLMLSLGLGNNFSVDFRGYRFENTSYHIKGNLLYHLKPNLGFLAGGFTSNQLVSNTYKDFFNNYPSGYILFTPNQYIPEPIIRYSHWGLYGGSYLELSWGRATLLGSLSIGASQNVPFTILVGQKKLNSNIRRELEYNANRNLFLFVMPEITLGIDIFELESSTFGLEITCNAMVSNKSISYELTERVWTASNTESQSIDIPSRIVTDLRYDVSIFWKF
ncbi:MAG: hypothetical protein RBT19_13075 [Tenuifilaceae bacterium]|jgi:hypothetical protein|nr:hypothetical protein [Tenuifilaceae bacterium]